MEAARTSPAVEPLVEARELGLPPGQGHGEARGRIHERGPAPALRVRSNAVLEHHLGLAAPGPARLAPRGEPLLGVPVPWDRLRAVDLEARSIVEHWGT